MGRKKRRGGVGGPIETSKPLKLEWKRENRGFLTAQRPEQLTRTSPVPREMGRNSSASQRTRQPHGQPGTPLPCEGDGQPGQGAASPACSHSACYTAGIGMQGSIWGRRGAGQARGGWRSLKMGWHSRRCGDNCYKYRKPWVLPAS